MRLLLLFLVAGCATQEKPPPKIEMVAMDPLPPASAEPSASTLPPVIDAGVDPHHKELVIGKIITIPAEGVHNYSVASDNIDVRLTPDGKSFVISGKKAGRVDLLLIKKDRTQEPFTFEVYDH